MCRHIRPLFNFEPPVTDDEIRAASLQFVRKLSGFNKPSKANEPAFHAAIDEIAAVAEEPLRVHNAAKGEGPGIPRGDRRDRGGVEAAAPLARDVGAAEEPRRRRRES